MWSILRGRRKPKALPPAEKAPLVPGGPKAYEWILQAGLIDGEGSFTSDGLRAVLDELEKQEDGAYKTLIARLVVTAKRAFRAAHAMQARIAQLEHNLDDADGRVREAEKKVRAIEETRKAASKTQPATDPSVESRIRELEASIEDRKNQCARYVEELAVANERIAEIDAETARATRLMERLTAEFRERCGVSPSPGTPGDPDVPDVGT